jgi:hypothetical protein
LSGAATEDVVTEIHDYLTNTSTELRDNKVDLDDLIVFKVKTIGMDTQLTY